jgi:hypothetical protein
MKVERILAPNPGPYTGPGTNTYLVGDEVGLAVIDPGPIEASHEAAIVAAIGDRVGHGGRGDTHPPRPRTPGQPVGTAAGGGRLRLRPRSRVRS